MDARRDRQIRYSVRALPSVDCPRERAHRGCESRGRKEDTDYYGQLWCLSPKAGQEDRSLTTCAGMANPLTPSYCILGQVADCWIIVHLLVLRQGLSEEGERGHLEVPELQEADCWWRLDCLVRASLQHG
jgi:hypothetical protein